jgi:phosphonate transport system substrate-binding protein
MIRRHLMGAAVLATLCLAACSKPSEPANGQTPKVVNFSILATENSTSLESEWKPILADMEKSIGIKVKPFYGSNYTALIEALRFKQTDAGWFSNLSGLEAVRRGGGEVFARTFDPSMQDGYRSIIIVPAKSKTTLEDVLKCGKSLNFGIGDAKSTSGTLAPMTYLFAPKNIRPQDCFKTVRSANHQANLFSVAKGVLDVATNNTTSLRLQKEKEDADPNAPRIADSVRVIWESPKLPEDPIIWRKDLDPAVKEKLRQFFLTYGQGDGPEAERQRKLLARLSIGGFKPADNSHLLPVREMEATEALESAKNTRDAAKIAAAQQAFDAVKTERAALEAKTGQPVQ